MASRVSSISQALASSAAAARIPPPLASTGAYGADHVAAASAKGKQGETGLPTPPNSISPSLPEAFRNKFNADIESDIDLEDHRGGRKLSRSSADKSEDDDDRLGRVGNITPEFLAKYHLADLVLDKGPIAIRHVMNHLSLTVPGFSHIAPPKARRITVAALESKAGGGPDGTVEFEKVGWGRWDAKVRGQAREPPLQPIHEDLSPPSTAMSISAPSRTSALQIPGSRSRPRHRRPSQGSWTNEPPSKSVYDHFDRDVSEYGADAMSIDMDDDDARNLYRPRSVVDSHMDSASETDEEDWSTMGAERLRDGLGASAPGKPIHFTTLGTSAGRSRSRGWSPYPRSLAQSLPSHAPASQRHASDASNYDFDGLNMDAQEQDAIAALVTMSAR